MKPLITTFTGKRIDLFAMRSDDICIEDIAHALALCNRFAGHTRVPLSVAQHSVYVSRLSGSMDTPMGLRKAMQGLLHDASEAYLGDVTKWLKSKLPAYQQAEDSIQRQIFCKYNCEMGYFNGAALFQEVEEADRLMCRYEAHRLMPRLDVPDSQGSIYQGMTRTEVEKSGIGHWLPWGWRTAEDVFLGTFRTITLLREKK